MKLKCNECGKEFEKSTGEYNRKIKLGKTKFYCGLSCAGKNSSSHLKKWHGRNNDNLKSENRRDEFSPFRQFIRSAKKRRDKDKTDIDVEYLKELWESQNGICSLTNIKMTLERNHLPFQASLDRIDCTKGYIKGNVRFICLIANYARNQWTDEAVVEFISKANNKRCSCFHFSKTIFKDDHIVGQKLGRNT